jgi:hypothetical protein
VLITFYPGKRGADEDADGKDDQDNAKSLGIELSEPESLGSWVPGRPPVSGQSERLNVPDLTQTSFLSPRIPLSSL